ncbi:MAG: type IV pilus assembly protein PilM [Bacillati bacterium ANGP1]|uniref:Type IV pilus assembly protein PilM n=1 Tax=Candidatus Segetimicrobium genomatis TaxID=2569760 RepID=A0A537JWD0_9BACT|nr:MAG: type IV pilus assembly protein PilM [Terrabacteria group bacterium ANGP1]
MGLFGSRSSIGLDLGSHTLKAVEVVPAGGGRHKVARLGVIPTPQGAIADGAAASAEVLGMAIRNLLTTAGIKGNRVVTALGGEAVIVRELKLPEMPDAELEQAVAYEAERYLPYGVKEVSRDFQVLGKAAEEGQVEILLVAARKEVVDRQLAALHTIGLSASILDVAPFSMLRSVARRDGQAQGTIIYVDLGAESSDIIIMEGERLRLARNISTGGTAVTKAIADALSLELPAAQTLKEERAQLLLEGQQPGDNTLVQVHEAILPVINSIFTEVRRSLDYYQTRSRGQAVSKVMLTGGTAKLKNLAPFLSEELGLPVEIGNPFASCSADAFPKEYLSDVGPMMAVAVGLALRGE